MNFILHALNCDPLPIVHDFFFDSQSSLAATASADRTLGWRSRGTPGTLGMKPLLHALIVEDSENDTRILLNDLERSEYEISHERVETAESLIAALDRQRWDILFCDFTMPHFSGLRALEIVKERKIDLPFIFVSGTLGEDVAVQAMKLGADDYVVKGNLARLVPAMERELREANGRLMRRNAEEDMRISEYKYRQVFESLGDAAFLIDQETGRIIDTNPQAEVLLGRSRAQILGTRENHLFWPRRERAEMPAFLSTGDGRPRFETNVLQAKGGIVPVDVSVSRLELYGRSLLLALFHDITGRRRSEQKIEEQANLLELAHDAIFVRSLDEKIQYWNKGAEHLYGWTAEEAIAGQFERSAYDDYTSFAAAKKILLKEERWSGEVRMRTKSRREIMVASSWTLVHAPGRDLASILVIDTDITAKNQMEVQFLRAQRVELIGTLAAGIAHDLNNILQIIITNLDLANITPVLDRHLPKYLKDASHGADRATNLARRLLAFSKDGVSKKRSLDVAGLLTPAVLLALSGSKLKPFFAFQPGLYSVIGDPVQLTQVIENLVLNACEAAPQLGKLLVRADNVDETLPPPSGLASGRYVRIEIEDTGAGIPEEIRDRIFDVCFTTKPGGSGLGLSTVRSIMQQHRGGVTIKSHVGHGTTVSLLLPAAMQHPKPSPAPLPIPAVKTLGRILIIDDDEMILNVLTAMLNSLGYKCAVARDGVEGCNEYVRAQAEGQPFAAVLLDATIPNGLSGEEALKLLLQADRDARVILCSGYTESDLFREAEQLGFRAILGKPFSISEFVSVFNKVLA
jgi:PAS domain S-box-containing protein